MTPEQLAVDRAICEAATPGPWHVFEECGDYGARTVLGPNNEDIITCDNNGCASDPSPDYIALKNGDAAFIAAARERWPAALREIERLRAALAEIARETGTPYARIAQAALDGTP